MGYCVNGEWKESKSEKYMDVTDSSTGEVIARVPCCTADEVEEYIGHAPGGVCPFGIKDGIKVYLDESLKRFETVYPAAGNDHSAVRLTIAELEAVAGAEKWVDVCKE